MLLLRGVPVAKFETVVVKPSEIQQDMVQALSERAAEVHSGSVDPSVDNMLKITSDGRKIGLDQRLMNSALPDDPNSKLNACVNNVLRIWNDTKEQKLTQLIFCDMSTPKGDGSFNVYDDIRTKLLNAGVPEQEIEFIHLFLNQTLLSFCGQGYLFKLAVSDDNCIVVAGRNSRTEFFAISGFKIFFAGNQQLCIGVQA